MNLRKRYLDGMLGHDVLVVTSDSRSFKGVLIEYDEEAMLLQAVIETSTREIKWHKPEVAMPVNPDGTGGVIQRRLDEVMILTDHVMRIWRQE